MTRETKVGLIVGGSFLVLLGVVIASKMRGGHEQTEDEVASTVRPGGEESETPDKKGLPAAPKPLPEIKPTAAVDPPKDKGLPAVPALDFGKIDLPPLPDEDQAKKVAELKIAKGDPPPMLPPAVDPPPLAPPAGKGGLDLPPIPKIDELPPLPPPPGKDDKARPPLDPPKVVVADPPPALFPKGKDVIPPPLPVDLGPFAKDDKKKDEKVLPPPVDLGPFAKKDEKTPPVGLAPLVLDKKEVNPPPPLGADIKPPAAPPVGLGKDLPRVVTIDIPPYTLRPEDKDMESVSRRLYGSDRYAAALLAFNREHPKARDEIRLSPPRLITGQVLYVPPKDLLETKYAALISDVRPVIGIPDGPPKLNPLPPLGDPRPAAGSPVSLGPVGGPKPVAGTPTTDATRRYIVPADMHIIQIAQQTLGDGKRWPQIYRLNPGLQPANLVPSGTELRLPTDARVP